ncbi:hypothetical protein SK128_015053 [Halocaridina rubra]|uniref:RING-type domain-containing protein n=1 Tax=Halocaridina rubra TaxID=373956 RepID=A0AAN8WYY0_HALRR
MFLDELLHESKYLRNRGDENSDGYSCSEEPGRRRTKTYEKLNEEDHVSETEDKRRGYSETRRKKRIPKSTDDQDDSYENIHMGKDPEDNIRDLMNDNTIEDSHQCQVNGKVFYNEAYIRHLEEIPHQMYMKKRFEKKNKGKRKIIQKCRTDDVENLQRRGESEEICIDRDSAHQRRGESEEICNDRDFAHQRRGESEEIYNEKDFLHQRRGESEEIYNDRDFAHQRRGEFDEIYNDRDFAHQGRGESEEIYNDRDFAHQRRGEFDEIYNDRDFAHQRRGESEEIYNDRDFLHQRRSESGEIYNEGDFVHRKENFNKEDAENEDVLGSQQEECQICCEDVLLSDMVACNAKNKHKFCRNCIKRFVEEEIGQGRVTFRCVELDCQGKFSMRNLKTLVSETVFERLMQRQQHEEISNAGIKDLLQCPFCDFMMILPDKKDVVFLCQNPECLKDSCRFCKEPNHCPQTCEEVKADKQKDVRTMLENRMAEAMIRECGKCKKRFIKEAGCNMMTCACGAKMCYVCKQNITGYQHFGTKCSLHSDTNAIHETDVKRAAADAKQQLDPNIKLIHDPTKDVL